MKSLHIIACQILASVTCLHGEDFPMTLNLQDVLREAPPDRRFYPTEVAFYSGRLYVGSSAGLMEISGSKFEKLYRWDTVDPTLEGPWLDRAGNLLWIWLDGQHKVLSFDGKTWRSVPAPRPNEGHFTRDDALRGFEGISNHRFFWVVWARRAWRWNGGRWAEEAAPVVSTGRRGRPSRIKALMPTDNATYLLMRDGSEPPAVLQSIAERFNWYDRIKGDSVYYRENGHWNCVTNLVPKYFAVEAVGAGISGYLRAEAGELLEATKVGVRELDAPGRCEALAVSPDGKLIASFEAMGVFELDHGWRRLMKPVRSSPAGHSVTHLAIQKDQVALAVTPLPFPDKDAGLSYDTRPGLWVSRSNEWEEVSLPGGSH
jgi:hypothetical protein